jgi:hypothetical protein
MNAVIHHASGAVTRRAIRDFGQNLVSEAKHEIANHLKSQDIDEISDAILDRCSEQFLDRAMERRLTTIDARSLINALARAERLGYENSDVLEDRRERVVPATQMHSSVFTRENATTASLQSQPAHSTPTSAHAPLPPQSQQSSRNVGPGTILQCLQCWRTFKHNKPYEYVSCDYLPFVCLKLIQM